MEFVRRCRGDGYCDLVGGISVNNLFINKKQMGEHGGRDSRPATCHSSLKGINWDKNYGANSNVNKFTCQHEFSMIPGPYQLRRSFRQVRSTEFQGQEGLPLLELRIDNDIQHLPGRHLSLIRIYDSGFNKQASSKSPTSTTESQGTIQSFSSDQEMAVFSY